MPSPVGHMLGGVAAGWLVAGREAGPSVTRARDLRERVAAWPRTIAFAAIGAAPDLDLLFGAHSTYTHSVAAVVLTAVAVLAWTRAREPRLAFGCAAAVSSHILLDWLGTDTSAPIGIMALWPFTREFYQSPFFVFHAISRRWWMAGFYAQNGVAVLRELAILVPVVLLAGAVSRCAPRRPAHAVWSRPKQG